MSSRLDAKAAARAAREAEEQRAGAVAARARRLRLLLAALAGTALIVAGAVVLSQGGSDTKNAKPAVTPTQSASLFAGIPQNGVVLGSAKAPVTVTEYADLQCPFCGQFSNQQLPAVVRDYIRTGKARLVFRNLSFIGPDSKKAARFAAGAAMQGKLFDFVDRFYAHQQTENTGYVTDGFLRKVAAEVPGLDAAKAFKDGGSTAAARQLAAAEAEARLRGVNSTPTFVIGGKSYSADQLAAALQSATAA